MTVDLMKDLIREKVGDNSEWNSFIIEPFLDDEILTCYDQEEKLEIYLCEGKKYTRLDFLIHCIVGSNLKKPLRCYLIPGKEIPETIQNTIYSIAVLLSLRIEFCMVKLNGIQYGTIKIV